jgi:SAM-dependent methyltransferase
MSRSRAAARTVARRCWCGSSEARPLWAVTTPEGRFRYVRCNGCDVVAQWPQASDEALTRAYSAEYYGASREKFAGPIARLVSRFQQGRALRVRDELRTHGPQARILDIGCGNGGFLLQLRELGFRNLEGTEWTSQSAARVPKRSGIQVHVGDLLQLELKPKSYNAIIIWHVLEHLRDPESTLRRCHDLLKPGGLLFLAFPNHESTQAQRYGRHWFHLDPPRHLHGFGPTSLAALFRATHFHLHDVTTFSFEQDPYGWIQSQLNQWGFSRERAYSTLKRTGDHGLVQRLEDLALLAALTPFGVGASLIAAAMDRGGTLQVIAQKD